jgi:branched-chain amino acid transport system substrate-binding protein
VLAARKQQEIWEDLMAFHRTWLTASVVIGSIAMAPSSVTAQKRYDPGASDYEIKIGNMAPYSGPLSAYSVIAKTEAAYFNKINAEGGINGRKIKFISYDDAYNPAKGVEQGRKLVESDEVLLIFQSLGVGALAIRKYLNDRKIPQLFVAGGASAFAENFSVDYRVPADIRDRGTHFREISP